MKDMFGLQDGAFWGEGLGTWQAAKLSWATEKGGAVVVFSDSCWCQQKNIFVHPYTWEKMIWWSNLTWLILFFRWIGSTNHLTISNGVLHEKITYPKRIGMERWICKIFLQDAKGGEDANSSQRNCVICDLAKKVPCLGCPLGKKGCKWLGISGWVITPIYLMYK